MPHLLSLLPDFALEDEMVIIQAFYRAFAGDFDNYAFFKYPGLFYLVIIPLYYALFLAYNFKTLIHLKTLSDFLNFASHPVLSEAGMVLIGRTLSLFFGITSALVLVEIFKKRASKRISLIGALILLSSPTWLFCSEILKNDTLLLFLVYLTFWSSLLIYEQGKKKHYILAGILAGLCLACKLYFFSLILPVIAHWRKAKKENKNGIEIWGEKKILLSFLICLLTFLLFNPFQALQPKNTFKETLLELALMRGAQNILQASPELWYHSTFLFQILCALPLAMGILGFLAGAGGIFFLTKKLKRDEFIIYISCPAFYFFFWAVVSEQGLPHYYLTLAGFLAPAGGAFFDWLLSRRTFVKAVGILALFFSVMFNFLFSQEINQAQESIMKESFSWAYENISPKEKVYAFLPYRPLYESNYYWRFEFYPQFMLTKKLLKKAKPKRLLIHEFYYFAYLNNPQARNPSWWGFLELYQKGSGYELKRRWQNKLFWAKIYKKLFPDLNYISVGYYELTF